MSQKKTAISTIQLGVTAVFTALVCAATMVFSIYVPSTEGFFNIGETMVYTTALLFGPVVGAFAGGVGSMFADIFLGYPHYAVATLLIKACEGGVVGFLSRRRPSFESKTEWKAFTFVVGAPIGVLLGTIGLLYYSGSVDISFGIPALQSGTLSMFIPAELWVCLGVLVILLITGMGMVLEPEVGWQAFAATLGGLTMVSGYFIYQQFFLGWLFPSMKVVALAEIPVNVGQMTIGLIVSIPIVRAVFRAVPTIRKITH
ncbi:MAG: ECF transporter S component [Thermoproteota archaeon]|nr:ECF transporter S component [Thermoproteota archaeon]